MTTPTPRLRVFALALLVIGAFVLFAKATETSPKVAEREFVAGHDLASMSLEVLEERLQRCDVVQQLSDAKAATLEDSQASAMKTAFAYLFPGSPAVNSLLATLYISGPPNFLLALCPPNIDPDSLTIMVAFAVGGLMGDTLFHLLPEIFLGEDEPDKVRLVLVEPNRNLLLGVAILAGFMTFVAMDKGLRIATGGQGHSHDHGHSHSHEDTHVQAKQCDSGITSATDLKADGMAQRKGKASSQKSTEKLANAEEKQLNPSVKLGGYLNLIADFTHNITDGLAMSASFYASPTVGASTMLAVFLHEIPHEVGDFALLIQSGFSKRAAMGAQFVTAIGAFLGTAIGIAIQELSVGDVDEHGMPRNGGIWGTSLSMGDLLLPFTAGTFLYVGTVSVIPELLETGSNKSAEIKKTLGQFSAVALGAGIMLYISWE
ncbi:ZIP Zinc transporter [Ceratocystis lukuohia]|uniref:Uncharacterized protein n=2 Tax=Ceratocystis TaxID=5157 RepID=A0A0F8CSC1_CERFI|nr:hypothetical protein CFO_g4024 [Ceratocystis platani]